MNDISSNAAPATKPLAAKGTIAAIIALAAGLVATGGYAVHENGNAKQMSDQQAQMQQSLASTNAQIAALTGKLNDLTAPKPQTVSQPVHTGHVRKHRPAGISDARWKKMQAQMDDQGKAIDATRADLASTKSDLATTRNDLTSAKTELGGSIARTHDQLVVLERKGEHSYYEFDLDRAKHFTSEGPVGVRLRKANVKHQYADLELLVDDASLTQKHVNLLQPAIFYAADSEQPIE
ncbi:MAG TPA: hypothetical protein VGR50_03080, partial [Terriglobales bacterium]|nr:hypothetical protein [Terriglobales bacterium]